VEAIRRYASPMHKLAYTIAKRMKYIHIVSAEYHLQAAIATALN
jgi:hypothetical protein